MPKYRVRLEDGGGEFRLTSLVADDEDAARAACERMEFKRAAYQLPPETLAEMEIEEVDPDTQTTGQTRWALVVHRQAEPYKVVSVEEVK